MKSLIKLCTIFLCIFSQMLQALEERHLIVIRHGEDDHHILQIYNSDPRHSNYKPSHLTEQGKKQVKSTAELLLTYGFDNRSIAAVYVSPLPRTEQTAQIFAQIGLFTKDKIHIDKRLSEMSSGEREGLPYLKYTKDAWYVGQQEAKSYHGESNEQVKQRMIAFYDEIEKKYPKGHILVITDGVPAMELIDVLTKTKVKLQTAQAYLVPLTQRNQLA